MLNLKYFAKLAENKAGLKINSEFVRMTIKNSPYNSIEIIWRIKQRNKVIAILVASKVFTYAPFYGSEK